MIDAMKHKVTAEFEGKTTYIYKGPVLPILKLMGLKKSGPTYKRVKDAIIRMTNASIQLYNSKNKKWKVNNLLINAEGDDNEQELSITVNPYFYETYIAGSVTLLDVILRSEFSSPIAKTLFRFIQSHRDDRWSGHFLTLSASLNLDIEQPPKQIRRQLKNAITSLKNKGVLSNGSGLKNDIVTLLRKPRQLPHR